MKIGIIGAGQIGGTLTALLVKAGHEVWLANTRDGPIRPLDDELTTETEMLAAKFSQSKVVKMFNTIYYEHLRDQGQPTGSPGRRALPMAGDDTEAKATVAAVVDQIGFDTVDIGSLDAGQVRAVLNV